MGKGGFEEVERQRKGSPGRDGGTVCTGPGGLVRHWLEDLCGAVLRYEAENRPMWGGRRH